MTVRNAILDTIFANAIPGAALGLAALAIATGPAIALDGPGRALVVSNNVRAAANAAIAGDPGEQVNRTFIPPYSGTVRLTWEIRSHDGTQVSASPFMIHVDGCPDRTTTSTSFVVQTCDIRVAGGAALIVRASTSNGANFVTLRRVQMKYDVVNSTGKTIDWELQLSARPRHGVVAALDGPGRAVVASNQIHRAVNAPIVGQPGNTVSTGFIPPYSGTARLSWEIRSHDGTNVSSDVFVNHLSSCSGAPSASTTFVRRTCDLRVTGGMPVTVSASASGPNFVTLRRVQLNYDVVNSDGRAVVYEAQATQ
jgi:hypothetical protein